MFMKVYLVKKVIGISIIFLHNFSTDFTNNFFNGFFEFYSSGSNVLDNTNRLKTSINNNLNYSSLDYFSNLGLKNNYNILVKNLNTLAKNHSVYKSSPQSQFMSLFEFNSSFPLEKFTEFYEESIIPEISFDLIQVI